MKNGVNIAGVSETAYEIRDRPVEAQTFYRATGHWDAGGQLSAHVGTITLGTLRVARDFRFHCMPGPRAGSAAPAHEHLTPTEMALIGAGACLLATVVLGSTTKGHTLGGASLLLARAEPGAAWNVEYDLAVHGDMQPEALIATLQEASLRSPNHRTLVEPDAISWSLSDPPPARARSNDIVTSTREVAVAPEDWPFPNDRRRVAGRRHLAVRWDYGLQLSVWPDSEAARQSRFPVDQPKQFGGMDRGPNPQEYLLSGLAASVVETAAALARARDLDVQAVSCRAQGRVDLHGFLGLDPRVPDRMQDLSCALSFRGSLSPEQQAALAKEAVETAEVARLLSSAQPVRISLYRDGEPIHELTCAPA